MTKTIAPNIIALDIGGTKINAGLVDKFGKIRQNRKIVTPKNIGADKFIEKITELINSLKNRQSAKIGIAFAGQVSWPDGKIINSPNLKFLNGQPLKKEITKKTKLPVAIDNDAHCFTLAESIFGRGKRYNLVVGLTLGTGIGGGLVINRQLLRGANNTAGEFGHMSLTDQGFRCSCKLDGHLESYSSGQAMVKLFKSLTGNELDSFAIEKLYYRRNKSARLVFDTMADYLGLGLAEIANTLNPDIIILGGGLVRVKPIWKTAVKKYFPRYVFYPLLKKTRIVATKPGENSILLGAALITAEK